ncbi:MAG: twin-arginine translocase TatA/TatE family subunit [Actinomycetota bacterium]|nr:twin-arginine translocase TatA/TatE family subunit [Actinomycetota bacterium]
MGNLGAPEMILVAVVALIVFGPKRLPEIARTIGKAVREFKAATADFTNELTSLEPSAKRPETVQHEPPTEDPRPGPRP